MRLVKRDLWSALAKAAAEHPRLNIRNSRKFMRIFIQKLTLNQVLEIEKQLPFWQVLRNTLNECELKPGDGREAYKALVGYYFGRNGNAVARSRRKRGLPAKKLHLPKYNAVEENSGQFVWQM